ncbi:MAG TPA: hypothetical protein PLX10_01150 [Candidatus Paceibacterota bacterium]|nr:hypothetical protein [Candidatus Paceibacterota bacterium]
MSKTKIIWLVTAIVLVVLLSVLLAYKDKLLPTAGYVYVLKPLPTKVPIVSGPMCGWCGNSCVNWKNSDARRIHCADVMPATGTECIAENDACVLKTTGVQAE